MQGKSFEEYRSQKNVRSTDARLSAAAVRGIPELSNGFSAMPSPPEPRSRSDELEAIERIPDNPLLVGCSEAEVLAKLVPSCADEEQ
jgi:hypothetical protein